MARKYPAGTIYASTSVPILNAYPFTIALWFQNNSASPSDNQNLVNIGSTGANSSKDNIGLDVDQATKKLVYFSSNSSGSFTNLTISGAALTAGVWHAGMISAASATSRTGYQDGAGVLDTTNIVLGTTQTNAWLGTYQAGTHTTDCGPIAEVAFWNVALTAAEAAAHAAGVPVTRIRPLSLKGYWPLYGITSPEPDLSGFKNSFTDFGSNVAMNHPPISLRTVRRSAFAPIGSGGGGSTIVERRSLSLLGARAGSRQAA